MQISAVNLFNLPWALHLLNSLPVTCSNRYPFSTLSNEAFAMIDLLSVCNDQCEAFRVYILYTYARVSQRL